MEPGRDTCSDVQSSGLHGLIRSQSTLDCIGLEDYTVHASLEHFVLQIEAAVLDGVRCNRRGKLSAGAKARRRTHLASYRNR